MNEIDIIIGQKIKHLREGIKLSQEKISKMFGGLQTSLYRYEIGENSVPHNVLLWYADYFDVSLDWLYGRCDNPQGKKYSYTPENFKNKFNNDKEIKDFVNMCFEPNSPVGERLKQTLTEILKGDARDTDQ